MHFFPLDTRQCYHPRLPYIERDAVCQNHWRESSGKSGRTLYECISVTDGIKINEQNKSIGIGPLYLQFTRCEIEIGINKTCMPCNTNRRLLHYDHYKCIHVYMHTLHRNALQQYTQHQLQVRIWSVLSLQHHLRLETC